ncbi:hypothetical protein [Leptodesmis sichuanensis]|uniref:hypothetical protein n=1 Tax=Leptodesmis sichuanensis TaxID=2906798 RepID=UPI001F218200|nr:hypothetical protein [Leptodesmis sichuanensis]UIE37327.1 hypothetical protein KIK02_20645 [Leptodesmis sichuanensis A121]
MRRCVFYDPIAHLRPPQPAPAVYATDGIGVGGKYDEYGNRREVDMDIAGCTMPYCSKIESIDEPRRTAAATGQ